MKESIYTIPISEAFEEAEGCPFCDIRRSLEQRWVEYITGPAMMEPDVRQKTNKTGFCGAHYAKMLEQKNRLAIALMLQTHLADLNERLSGKADFFGKNGLNAADCFVCERIDSEFGRILENVAVFWAREPDFQQLYMHQKYVCPADCGAVLAAAKKKLRGKQFAEFSAATRTLTAKRLLSLKADVDAFCKLFDYRSAGGAAPSEEVSTAIERSISFLTGAADYNVK